MLDQADELVGDPLDRAIGHEPPPVFNVAVTLPELPRGRPQCVPRGGTGHPIGFEEGSASSVTEKGAQLAGDLSQFAVSLFFGRQAAITFCHDAPPCPPEPLTDATAFRPPVFARGFPLWGVRIAVLGGTD